ncbi:hypothetical protein QVD17_16834 [Tagetes erecta]|uniref:SWIM-type domain-containing protein n=1 Tax=Tagetes erecta TaxID=13708 RepID=A0AAD8KVP8_TARER|nr:hypothetical protein QVD17_16834 [Tagetes erecta]
MVQSPTLEQNVLQIPSKYKIKLKHGGYFRFAKNSSRTRYCFGYQKCIYIDTYMYNFDDLIEEATSRYPSNRDLVFSIYFLDKYASKQSFIKLDSNEDFQMMLLMYDVEKEITVYVTTNNNLETLSRLNLEISSNVSIQSGQDEVDDESNNQEESEYSLSDESYHSYYSSDSEFEMHIFQEEICSKKTPIIKVNSTFDNVNVFRRALIHHAVINEFAYFLEKSEPTRVTASCIDKECKWRIHASVKQDGITFEKLVVPHSCTRSNKGGNKVATQGWISSVVRDKLKSDGYVSPKELQKWVMKNYNNLGEYEVCRSGEYRAEVKYGEKRWEVTLDERICTCRVWEVRGVPCVHASAFIAFTRGDWDSCVDSYFTIEKSKHY